MQPESAACTSKGLQHLSLLVKLQAEPAPVLGLDEVDHAAYVVHHVEVVAIAGRVLHLAPHCPAVSSTFYSTVCSGSHHSVYLQNGRARCYMGLHASHIRHLECAYADCVSRLWYSDFPKLLSPDCHPPGLPFMLKPRC